MNLGSIELSKERCKLLSNILEIVENLWPSEKFKLNLSFCFIRKGLLYSNKGKGNIYWWTRGWKETFIHCRMKWKIDAYTVEISTEFPQKAMYLSYGSAILLLSNVPGLYIFLQRYLLIHVHCCYFYGR